jgi:hypothetical protein
MRVLVCVACRCEVERIEIAGGVAVVLCVECRLTGDEAHFAHGARLADMPQEPRRPERRATPQRSARSGSGKRLAAR